MGKASEDTLLPGKSKESKERLRKTLKKKKNKERKKEGRQQVRQENESIILKADTLVAKSLTSLEYVEEDEYIQAGQYYEEFKNVFQYFKRKGPLEEAADEKKKETPVHQDGLDTACSEQSETMSKKKRKMMSRMPVAQLKALSKRPDLVEAWDVTASDPLLLSFLKGYRNTVAVPKHWSQKRKFLQSKRGILKQPFQLPDYIEATGIARLRDPFSNDGMKMVKQKLRERMNPKLGKVDIDYEILHDAFFKYQTKPKLTIFGDIYYEGKENEVKMRTYKPGRISEQLRAALGIGELAPPPWIINMQRYGPPPAYPNLKIPGVTVPMNEAILGNIFFGRPSEEREVKEEEGLQQHQQQQQQYEQQYLWGEVEEEEQYEQEIDEELPVENNIEASNIDFMSTSDPTVQPPEVEVRKANASLYQVLEQVQPQPGNSMFPQGHTYKMPDNAYQF